MRKGLRHEVERQAKILRSGGQIQQETRRYDESTGETILMRVKEGSADYRYFLSQTCHSMRLMIAGLRKFVQNCQSFQRLAVPTTWKTWA